MRRKRSYDIKVQQQDDGWYVVSVPGLPDVRTQTMERHDAEYLARHAIGQWLECPPNSIQVKVVD